MKLNLGVEDRRGVCPGGFLYGGTMGGAGDRKGRPYERVTSGAGDREGRPYEKASLA